MNIDWNSNFLWGILSLAGGGIFSFIFLSTIKLPLSSKTFKIKGSFIILFIFKLYLTNLIILERIKF